MGVSGYGFSQGQGFQRGFSEGFRALSQGERDGTGGEDFPEVLAVASPREGMGKAGLFNFLENFIFIFVLALFYFSYNDGVAGIPWARRSRIIGIMSSWPFRRVMRPGRQRVNLFLSSG